MKQRSLTEILTALETLVSNRGWIADNVNKYHANDVLLSSAAYANYAASIANLEDRQRQIEHELAVWVLAHQSDCVKLDSGWTTALITFTQFEAERTNHLEGNQVAPDPITTPELIIRDEWWTRPIPDYYAKLKSSKPERDEP